MPALRSVWFVFHIGTAAFSYACFILAGAAGIRYLYSEKNGGSETDLEAIDFMIYRLIALGLLLLTVTIVSGAIWAEQAWSSFWTWDPKEVWALITLLIYAAPLHEKLWKSFQKPMFFHIYGILAFLSVVITYFGVNLILGGIHAYN
jgi:cytochrome c-type biogenesis protein CcsB